MIFRYTHGNYYDQEISDIWHQFKYDKVSNFLLIEVHELLSLYFIRLV